MVSLESVSIINENIELLYSSCNSFQDGNLFASSMSKNAIHGSDSDENAAIEGSFHFNENEILNH